MDRTVGSTPGMVVSAGKSAVDSHDSTLRTLAGIGYGIEPASPARTHSDTHIFRVPLKVLSGCADFEVRSLTAPVHRDVSQGIHHADNGSVLMGVLQIEESALAPIERTVMRAYVHIHALLERLGFPHWLRVWNYLSDITGGNGDAERYRQFNTGRHHALALKPDFERLLPAATAVGTREGGLSIAFLASRQPGVQIENPRQLSAFKYPRDYGPKSPSFARATLLNCREHSLLFVSGTASIVGHATLRDGDPLGQFEEILTNLEALLAHTAATQFPGSDARAFQPHSFKVYVRSAAVFEAIAARLQQTLNAAASVAVLEADLCRRDLLVEIEALYQRPAQADEEG